MKKIIVYLFLIFLKSVFTEAGAQITDTMRGWTISECFKYATEHNIQISTLRLNELSSLQDLTAAKAVKIPSLSGSVSNSFNNANNNANGSLVNQLTTSGSYSVNSSIILWNDNSINNNIRLQELFTQSARLSIQQSLNNITLLITQSYLNILLSKENLKYITDLVSSSEARVKQGQMFYDAGSIAKKDLLQLQAQLSSDKYLLVQTQNAIRQNVLSLKQILQLRVDILFDILTPDSVSVASSLFTLHEVQQAALHDFPEIKIGKLGVDIASLDIARAKAGFKPTLNANGSLGTGYSDVITNAVYPKTSYFRQTGNNFYQRVGVTLSFPIFSNRINKTNLEKANIAYKAANLNLQNDQLILSQAVEQAYLNATNAMQSFDAANQQLQATTESYRITNEQFKLGAINIYDLLQQRNQYVQAVQAYTQAKYSALLQQKIYEFYMGRPVTL
ncbi:MAG TPA: TolC family protein [Chitinophagaceae bacterium]|nr:TolC family protein [Chitinophagaceae bacterium]